MKEPSGQALGILPVGPRQIPETTTPDTKILARTTFELNAIAAGNF
jgi:hypothetical protein